MPPYRLEVCITHSECDFEDQLEEMAIAALRSQGIGVIHGPVVFRIYPGGTPGVIPGTR